MRPSTIASCLVATLLLTHAAIAVAAGAMPVDATPVQREQAQARFQRARDLMAKKQYEQALVEFRASHDIVASPNTRLEIARCLHLMGRLVAAYAELGRTAIEARELTAQDNRYKRTGDAATSERSEIEPQLGFVALTIENPAEGTRVVVGGEELRRAAWAEPAPVAPGAADVVVETPGHAPVKRTVSLAAGQRTSLTIDAQSGEVAQAAQPAPPPPATQQPKNLAAVRPWAYVAGGVGAAGLLTFAIGGAMAKSTYDDLNSACGGGPCPPSKTGEISSGKTQETIANVGLVVGAVGAVAGVTLYVMSLSKSTPSSNAAIVVSPGWIGVRGSL